MCSGAGAEYSDELPGAPTIDFEGVWTFNAGQSGSNLPDVKLSPPAELCPDDSPRAYLWRSADNNLKLCFPLGTLDPDAFRKDRMLILGTGVDTGPGSDDSCV